MLSMKKRVVKTTACAVLGALLAGCVGSNAITGKVTEFNIKVVDNRYARAGVNFLLAPVYGISTAADYIVFNSLEFWTGHNPITGSPHIFDTEAETFIEVNDKVDPGLRDAPIKPVSNNRIIQSSEMKKINNNTFEMHIVYHSGDSAVLKGIKDGNQVSFYMDGEQVSTTSMAKLESLINQKA